MAIKYESLEKALNAAMNSFRTPRNLRKELRENISLFPDLKSAELRIANSESEYVALINIDKDDDAYTLMVSPIKRTYEKTYL